VRVKQETDGFSHDPIATSPSEHHEAPFSSSISNTATVIAANGTYNYDIALPQSNFQFARVMIMGPRRMFGTATNFRESAELFVTRDSTEAMGHSVRDAAMSFRVYAVTYTKMAGDSYLTHKVFDNNTIVGNRYIGVQDAYITGSTLRIVFKNWTGIARTLWVKGKALVW